MMTSYQFTMTPDDAENAVRAYQSKAYPEIYAVGIAAQVPVPWHTAVPIGIPKTGFPVESMAKVAARNIAAAIRGEPLGSHKEFGEMAAVCMMDAGNNGVMILADHMLPPRKAAVMIPSVPSEPTSRLFRS